MSNIETKLTEIGYKVEDIDEEYYDILTTDRPPPASLGFLVSKTDTLTVPVGSFELEIHQSKGLLNSKHEEGTTGAVVWRLSIPLAEFLLENLTSTHPLLGPTSTVLELGCGSAGVLALTVGTKVQRWIASDIDAILKPLARNIRENLGDEWVEKDGIFTHAGGGKASKGKKRGKNNSSAAGVGGAIETVVLNWEQTDLASHPSLQAVERVDMIICSDCVYNYALIKPLVETMVEASRLMVEKCGVAPVVVVAQEVRADDVLEAFLTAFEKEFVVWRVRTENCGERWREEVGGSAVLHGGVWKGGRE